MKSRLEVRVEFSDSGVGESWSDVSAYVYNLDGKLLARQAIEHEGEKLSSGRAVFELAGTPVVVKVGPDVDDPATLDRYSPVVKKIKLIDLKKATLSYQLHKSAWRCWIKRSYPVCGQVTTAEHAEPICFGEVDIYDVDIRSCFLRIPDRLIDRIRAGFIDLIVDPPPIRDEYAQKWPHWDDDFCGTPPGPRPISDSDILKKLSALPAEWSFAKSRFQTLDSAKVRLGKSMSRMEHHARQAWLDREAVDGIKNAHIINTNTAQFRELVIGRFHSFRYWLCWYPWIHWLWWPYCYHYGLEKLGTASLQPDGSFSINIFLSRCSETPDLWFRVRQKLEGTERVIYARYPVPCNTYWNHPAGHPVHLSVTSPFAVPCFHLPETDHDSTEKWVVPLAIGNYSMKLIYGTGAGTLPADNAKIGCYSSISTGLGNTLSVFHDGPFGGTLAIRLLFSSALEAAGIKYYRIKCQINETGAWMALTRPVLRHYSHYDAVSESLYFLPYPLGPLEKNGENALYEIPPVDPPNKAAEPYAQWCVIDAGTDLMNAFFDSTALVSGGSAMVEFKLELFNQDAVRVNPLSEGIMIRLPSNDDIWSMVTTVDPATVNASLLRDDPETPGYQVFAFRLCIDNRSPVAEIAPPSVQPSGNVAPDACGMTKFAATDTTATMSFTATHPGKFGMYSFTVNRGTTALSNLTREGQVDTAGPGASFSVTAPLRPDILGTCPAAAFSEQLYIWNMAFNGWSRIGPDASAIRAFALIPE